MKEKILETFADLGFKLEKSGDIGYSFGYEGLNLLYILNEDDEEFFSIALPCICDCNKDNALTAFALMEKINSSLKYVKANTLADSVWLFYERELVSEQEDLMPVMPRMIQHLEAALAFAHRTMPEIEKSMAEDNTDESDTENIAEEKAGDDNKSFFSHICRRFLDNFKDLASEDDTDEICSEEVKDEKTSDDNSNK